MNNIKLRLKPNSLSNKNRILRGVWSIVWLLLYRPTPRPLHLWRCFLLRMFGAKIGKGAHPYPSARIWAPWNLVMDDDSCLSEQVDCYCVDKIHLGKRATVSQYSFLCTASHDYQHRDMPLITAQIVIEDDAWVTADVFVGPGVTIGEGSVVGVRSTITKDVPNWTVVAGTPPKIIGPRKFIDV